ncbi:protein ZBED8-like [Limulus polyphemus]|uniref:Protein ZBED8-like n=1 Tax=Limulus polyphemus TaxID=6850 RepID=A0ABM1BX51_LIMPO|nr:protein ZBED8-like [Limulus polyphemus]
MLGNRSGFAALMKREIPEVRVTHCLLHRYALAAKTLPKCLQDVLSTCVKNVNVIRRRSLNHRLFQSFRESMDSENTVLLYHTEVRWLSRGRVLQRIFELRKEIKTFLKDQKLDLFSSFNSPELVQMLAYLTDIFTHLNELNISLQGSNKNVAIAHEKLASFKAKIPLWLRNIEKGNLARFPSLEEVVEEHESLLPEVATAIRIHLEQLLYAFDGYLFLCRKFGSQRLLDKEPVSVSVKPDEDPFKEGIIDIENDHTAKMEFEVKTLEDSRTFPRKYLLYLFPSQQHIFAK